MKVLNSYLFSTSSEIDAIKDLKRDLAQKVRITT